MLTFRITVAGISYIGIFPGQHAAAADAEQRYPTHWPAQVVRIGGQA